MSELIKRTITGAIYVLIVLAGTILHPIIFALVFGTLLFFTLSEFYNLIEKGGFHPQKWVGTLAGIVLFVVCFLVVSNVLPETFSLIFIPLLLILFSSSIFNNRVKPIENNVITVFGFIYIGFSFSTLTFIVHPSFPGSHDFNPWILTGVFFILWINDSLAYLGGTLLGKHKLAEKISPKKTWEGLISGAVFAIVMGIVNAVLFQSLNMINWIVIAVITVVFGTLGDLFQSVIKRALNVKDSGKVLPGHGGFLDRFDSLLFVAPAVYFWLVLIGTI